MKKALSASLAVALLLVSAQGTFAKSADVDTHVSVEKASKDQGEKGKGKDKGQTEDKKTGSTTDDVDQVEPEEDETAVEAETETEVEVEISTEDSLKVKTKVKEAVQTKKQIIELRQELKKSSEVTPELKATYEELVKSLEGKDLGQAIEVQKELLSRVYQKGNKEQFKKLGELYTKTGTDEVKAFVNGTEPQFDAQPFIKNGRALVPIRAISAALKAEVNYDEKTRSVVITRGEQKITLFLDKQEAVVGDKTIALDAKPEIKKGRLFLPLRFVSENLQATVDYQQEGKIVIIEDATTPTTETTDTTASTDSTTTTTESSSTEESETTTQQ